MRVITRAPAEAQVEASDWLQQAFRSDVARARSFRVIVSAVLLSILRGSFSFLSRALDPKAENVPRTQ